MNRKIILYGLLLLSIWACGKNAPGTQSELLVPKERAALPGLPIDPFFGIPDTMSLLDIAVGIIAYDYYKKPYFKPEEATILLWPSDGRHLKIESAERALLGYAYDPVRDTSILSENIAVTPHIGQQDLSPGRYFIGVVLNNQVKNGKNAYSSVEVELDKFSKVAIYKIFDEKSKNGEFEAWDK